VFPWYQATKEIENPPYQIRELGALERKGSSFGVERKGHG
jgi:hypothetical protein